MFFEEIAKLWQTYGYVYLQGLAGTLWLSLVTVVFAVIVGVLVALLKNSRFAPVRFVINVYIEVLRGTPILLQLYFFWILLPKIVPFELSDTQCIVTALIVNSSAYVAEVIRAGIQAVDIGQREAAMSLGLSNRHIMTKVIMPQAIKNILPALGNEFISIIKSTSLASVFFIPELTTSYRTVQAATFLAIPSITIAGLIYLVVAFTLSRLVGLFERRLKSHGR